MSTKDTLAQIVQRVHELNESMEIPVTVRFEITRKQPSYLVETQEGRKKLDDENGVLEWIKRLADTPDTLFIQHAHTTVRVLFSTAMDGHRTHEFRDPEGLLQFLDVASVSPSDLGKASDYKALDTLRKQQRDAADMIAKKEAELGVDVDLQREAADMKPAIG
jgi:hypothetical protein